MSDKFDFHFIAIGGVGQSALAKILLQLGYKVSGSDINESKYTKLVEKMGAKVFIGHDENNIKEKTKVVVSSAIKENNPELIKAKELNCEILHRSDCLKIISQKFPCFIGCSGTHGKTTTSGMISYILEKIQENPSYAIGGILPEFNTNAKGDINSKYFIAELDESDGTITKYSPDRLIINNLEADHLDHYKNGLVDIIATFEKVIENIANKQSTLYVNIDSKGCQEFISKTIHKNIITYSLEKSANYEARNIKYQELNSSFDVYKNNSLLQKNIELTVAGKHNVYNALAIISVLDDLGYDINSYKKFLKDFSGMGRRFQTVAQTKGIRIIDDYAHHPSEIQSTLSAIKHINKRKVIIFQPHRYTRLKGLWDDFLKSFNIADKLYVLDVFSAGDDFDKNYNSKIFVDKIKENNINAQYIQGDITNAARAISKELKENDLVLTLGAGDITKIGGIINDLLSK